MFLDLQTPYRATKSFYSVNPMYYVGFSTATIVASVILFQGFNTDDPANSISLLAGFVITFLGVHLLEISRKPMGIHAANGHSALEGGLMNPRLSSTGRMSIDGWNGVAGTSLGGNTPHSAGHARRGSGHRQSTTLFSAFEEDDGMDGVVLERLPEVEEGDDDDEADERTHLRSGGSRDRHRGDHSRSASNSPRVSQGDSRRTPR